MNEITLVDNQEELDKHPCPDCGKHSLRMSNVLYSCPLQFTFGCKNCGYSGKGEGHPIKVLTLEESIRKRPEMYVGCDNPEWDKLARETIADRTK